MDSLYDLSTNPTPTLTRIGQEQEPLILIDSFMEHASLIRQHAIDKPGFEDSKTFYPGVNMPISSEYTKALIANLSIQMKVALGLPAGKASRAISTYSIICNDSQTLSLGQRIPHFDTLSEKNIAFVHFLCDQKNTGTSFYKHRSTNYQHVNKSRSTQYYATLQQEMSAQQTAPQGYIHSSNSMFEKIHSVSAVFNRLVGYRGCCLHSGDIGPDLVLSQDPALGRLTITTFVEFS